MSAVRKAYDGLLAIAQKGKPFRYDQVFSESSEDNKTSIYGVGFNFRHTLAVPDIMKGQTVEGHLELQVIATTDACLQLRSLLTWTPADGHTHKPFTHYKISSESADILAQTPATTSATSSQGNHYTPGMMVVAMTNILLAAVRSDELFQVVRGHEYIGYEIDEPLSLKDRIIAEVHYDYHEEILQWLTETTVDVACMISGNPLQVVHPDELTKLFAWVKTLPEVIALQ